LGDEDVNLGKLKSLLDDKKIPAPMEPRKVVRIEAENFRTLENFTVEDRSSRSASHRLSVRRAKADAGRIRTPFDQPYTADSALYDVEVRYSDEKGGRCQFSLFVNGVQKGAPWPASKDTGEWTTHTIEGVTVASGDEIMVEVQRDAGESGKLARLTSGGLDYVQLNHKGRVSGSFPSLKSRFSFSGPLDDPDGPLPNPRGMELQVCPSAQGDAGRLTEIM
jgi:hypothetical protein